MLGERESGTARLEEAVAAYRLALEEGTRERVPLEWAQTQTNLGNALLMLGERESGTARLEEAVAAYRLALEESTRERVPLGWAQTQRNLGDALSRLGERESGTARLEEAVAAYRLALEEWTRERVPLQWARTQINLAYALNDLDRTTEAFDLLEELAASAPEGIYALVRLGDLLRHDENYEEAEKAYSRAIARIDGLRREHWALFYARGITYERTERWRQAEADFIKALELEPEQPFVLNYLGFSWAEMGLNLDRAKDMLNRAAELRPNDGFIIDSLGWLHYRLGEYQNAVVHLKRAVQLQPNSPEINDHLGDAYWQIGRQRDARAQWERTLTLELDQETKLQIEHKLKSGLPEPDLIRP
jgi:tetratricopeptide (TPR) repeat protein